MSEAGEVRDYETEAYEQGWRPKDQFQGDPEKWIDAKAFIERGEIVGPILRDNNRKLKGINRDLSKENLEIRQQMTDMRDSLETMRGMMERGQEAGYQRAKAEFEDQMRAAVRNGDETSFDRVRGEMAALDKRHDEIIAPAPKIDPKPAGPKQTQEFKDWFEDNKDWLLKDSTLASAATAAERELRASDDPLSEAEIWDKVGEMVQAKYPRRFGAATGVSPEAAPSPASSPRRAAGVLPPSGGASAGQARKGGIDSITDPEERKIARAAFNSVKRGIPAYTEADYMKVYITPNASVLDDAQRWRAKANGSAN